MGARLAPLVMVPQVFLYVTQTCNIRCLMCYSLETLERGTDLNFDDLLSVLAHFRTAGAWKLSLLGGEPTRYERLSDLISAAREIGYSFIRIATNGIFNEKLLDEPGIRCLNVICFSIDGATPEVNDRIRRGDRLSITLRNLDAARERGYEVRINATINACNIHQLFDLIQLAVDRGATEINLNPVVIMAAAKRSEDDLAIPPGSWRAAYNLVVERHREFPIRIKVAPFFASDDELAQHAAEGHRCHALDGDRKYIMANGDVFPCLVMIEDARFREALYENDSLRSTPTVLESCPDLHSYCRFLPAPGVPSAAAALGAPPAPALRPLCIFHKRRLSA